MSKIENNPLLDEHVIIAASRVKRPFQEKTNHRCPFCAGSEEVPEPLSEVISLPNKYPSLSMDYDDAKGVCEVILYSSDHEVPLAEKPLGFVKSVIEHWVKRDRDITKNHSEINYVFIFENYGKQIGVSLEHPHGQLYAFPFVPRIIKQKEKSMRHNCLYCDKKASQLLIIQENSNFVISAVTHAKWPFELHIYPKRHFGGLNQLNEVEKEDLAQALKISYLLLFRKFGKRVPYITSIYQKATRDASDHFHLHIELISPQITEHRLKYRAGVETSLGIFINSVDPSIFASEMRSMVGEIE